MPASWKQEVKAARNNLDQALRQVDRARHTLHATACAACTAGARPIDVSEWAQVTTQALHYWRKEASCEESQ